MPSIMDPLKAFMAVFFAHPIAQVFRTLKTQGKRVRIPQEAYFLFILFPYL